MAGAPATVTIDGSQGEGGGQIVRTSLALSVLLGRELVLFNIRAGRSKPGLQPQHLTAVRAAASISHAEVEGGAIGSTAIRFAPRGCYPGHYLFDVAEIRGSAGSVSLVFQTVLLPLAFAGAPSTLTLRGGTHVPWSPPGDYISQVFLPTLASMGLTASLELRQAGFYPPGGGLLEGSIAPLSGLQPLALTQRGALQRLTAVIRTAKLPGHVAERMAARVTNRLPARKLRVDAAEVEALSPGAWCQLVAEYKGSLAGFNSIGELRKPAERVADEALDAYEAFERTGAAVDMHLADQLLLPLSLAEGRSRFATEAVTQHLLTNAEVIRHFLPDGTIEIRGKKGQPGSVEVAGCGSARNAVLQRP
jgi:RNA 3'-terminal phosphate cyclase (ATP)